VPEIITIIMIKIGDKTEAILNYSF